MYFVAQLRYILRCFITIMPQFYCNLRHNPMFFLVLHGLS